jgi:hypothetical protein
MASSSIGQVGCHQRRLHKVQFIQRPSHRQYELRAANAEAKNLPCHVK